ncbi:MAG: CoA transferase [Gammaproteobacteria bacterium]|nr:CoA transferase [Gammaproteobacteria bacterium]MCP5198540.1 CoA transferase [Gammaproteobacteria bacterium]
MEAALDDLLVVSLEQAVAAPYCSRIFAEGGARVIKLERPEGDFARAYDTMIHGDSGYFVWLNGGKESVTVDLARDADKQLLDKLLARADVFVQNLRPGAVDRLGYGWERLHALNPRLVMCSISGYGLSGPYADMKAYDALIQAETGLCSVTGPPGQPSKVGASICDIATGLTAYGEIMKALYARGRGEAGRHVEVSLFGTLSEWMAVPLAMLEYAGKMLGGTGLDHAQICPYGAYQTADGELFLVVQNHAEWLRLCRVGLERPDLAEHPLFANNMLRVENRDALRTEIESVFANFTRAEMAARLKQAEIACGSINDIGDLARHPALQRHEVETSGQRASLIRRVGAPDLARVPALGEHDDAVRREFD